ncbi:phosphotransferase, partial [Georgenia sp. 10Sc9-8]|nr:phosphotransferase [Georgenia halotolerans]
MARTPLALAALATSAIPGLEVVGVRGSQRASGDVQTAEIVDATGWHWVVRCPVSAAAGAAMEAERALLQNLAAAVDEERLPFAVPRPAGDVELPEGGRAVVVPALAGRPLDLEQLGPGPGLSAGLGRAVAALHELPPEVVADAGLPVYDADSYRARCLAEVDEVARTGHVPAVLLERWEQALENVALWRFRTTPVHGDLHPESILVSGTEVTAMTTFTSAHVGDPAEDLAWLMASAPLDALDA